jgi:hypothetical protein
MAKTLKQKEEEAYTSSSFLLHVKLKLTVWQERRQS